MNTNARVARTMNKLKRDLAAAQPKPRRRTRSKIMEAIAEPMMRIPEVAPSQEPLDPSNAWQKAAEVMVEQVFLRNRDLADACRQPSAVIFVEVGPDWLHWVAEAFGRAIHPDAPIPVDGDSFEGDRFLSSFWKDDEPLAALWCEYRREAAPAKSKEKGPGGLAWALGRGLPVFGFAPSLDCLPKSFARVYERHVVVPPLDAEIVGKVITAICGAPSSIPIPEDLVGKITESDLSLAVRPNQTPDAFVDRLIRLVAKAETAAVGKPQLTLDDVGGMREAVQWGRALAKDLDDYKAKSLAWIDVDPGVLLVGPPGTGKTRFARALAGTCGVPLISGSLSDWQAAKTGHLGDLLGAMKATFDKARSAAPCILFIDEIDGFSDRRTELGSSRSYHVQVVNGLLELLDGIQGREGVVVVAAANTASTLDPALVRAGRLDTTIRIPLPSPQELERILRIHLAGDLADADLMPSVERTEGATGADAKKWVRGARRRARSDRRPMVLADLVAAMGVDRRPLPESVIRRFSIHEAGHAIATVLGRPGALVRVTVKQSLTTGGFCESRIGVESLFDGPEEARGHVRMMLAGRAAEEIVYGTPSAGGGGGAGSDLAQATVYAASMIVTYGLGGGESIMWLGIVTAANVEKILAAHPIVAAEVELMLTECYGEVLDQLRPRRDLIVALANMLVEKETISGEVVENLTISAEHPRNAKIAKQGPDQSGRMP